MSSELLKKEREYRKLNEKLESRAKELLQEVNDVLKFQDHFLEAQKNDVQIPPATVQKSKSAPLPVARNVKLNDDDCKTLGIPEDVNGMGTKALVHFLKTKLKKTQDDYNKMILQHKNKSDENKKLQSENQKLINEREKWLQNNHSSKNQLVKLENQINILNAKLQTKDVETAAIKKENEQLQKDIKAVKLASSNIEVKYNRALDDLERTKDSLRTSKQEEKDLRESSRKQINELTDLLKKVDKHKIELINGFKKQMLLIDNLKRQKAHIERLKLTEKVEQDFMKLINWETEY